MVLEHMNYQKTQIGSVSELGHMIALGELNGQLKAFLISCVFENLSPATIKDYEQKIGAFVKFCYSIGIKRPDQVTVNHVRMFLLKLRERCNPNSVHDYYGCINRLFNWIVSEEKLKTNPMDSMHPPKVPARIIRPFSPENIKDLLLLCDERTFLGIRNRAIILTFYDTGLRLSELTSIQLSDIDFDLGLIKVMGKGSKERVVGIGKGTQKALLKYLYIRYLDRDDKHPCLWVTEEFRPMQFRGIQIMIRRLGRRAKLSGVRCSPHTFRHTAAICCLRNGMGEFQLQVMLGHSTLEMTRRYTQALKSEDAVIAHRIASPVDRMFKK